MALKTAQFFALVLTAAALIPGGAHLLALPNKIALPAEQYFVAQGAYRGWALLGIVLLGALIAQFSLAVLVFHQRRPFALAALAFVCLGVSLLIFFVWTYPANVATNNWTQIPADWETFRRHWEYSHAVNALLVFAAFCFVVLSVLTARR